ncbi:MAG: hypothetical protein MUE99_11580 [Chitinophagaceae bacterium]|nr:hypothetical protein [Chitinophagaceae bacterium]
MIRRITLSRKLCTAVVLSIAGAIISGCGVSKSQFNPERKFSAGQLIEDFDIAWKTYKKNHPSYNWYGPEDSVNAVFEKVRASITDSLTEAEFRLRLSYAVAAIRCGHTTVSSSKAYSKFFKNSKTPQFPLSVKVWGNDSMVVLQNISKDTSNIKKGTIVTTIDSIGTSVFIRQMKEYISTDGFSDGFKELQISAAFGARFKWMYGLKNSYNIGYINEKGKDTSSVLPVYFPAKKDSLIKKDTSRRNQLNTNLKRPSYGFLKKKLLCLN